MALAGDSMCNDQFNGKTPFSEPETRAMRDFLTAEKENLKFVYNLHCFGNYLIIPYNYEMPNNAFVEIPDTMQFFKELIEEAEFPEEYKIGPATETLGFDTGGSSGDWINKQLGVPAAEVEIGSAEQIDLENGWMPKDNEASFDLADTSFKWIITTFRKTGNQIHMAPVGSSKMAANYTEEEAEKYDQRILLHLEVTNHGSSDQIHSDFLIRLENEKFRIVNSNTEYDQIPPWFRNSDMKNEINNFYLNGFKKRSKQVVQIPVDLAKEDGKENFYHGYSGNLETVVRYHEFFDQSSRLKA